MTLDGEARTFGCIPAVARPQKGFPQPLSPSARACVADPRLPSCSQPPAREMKGTFDAGEGLSSRLFIPVTFSESTPGPFCRFSSSA